MKEEYHLYNRIKGNKVYLKRIADANTYLLMSDNVSFFTESNIDGTSEPENPYIPIELYAIDPEGGPFLFVNKDINEYLIGDSIQERPVRVVKIEKHVSPNKYILTLEEVLSYREFYGDIVSAARATVKECPHLRFGQCVFNYTDSKYHVARAVQFSDRVDCFYVDSKVDDFIKAAYDWYAHPLKRH